MSSIHESVKELEKEEEEDKSDGIITNKGSLPEENRAEATEQEQKDFEEYEKQLKKQSKSIASYESLLEAKAKEEKQEQIHKCLIKLNARCTQLHAQEYKDPSIRDRLGKRSDFYRNIWDNITLNQDRFLGGDLDRQLELLKIVASQESDESKAEEIKEKLRGFESEITDQPRQ